jgi:hypothetical protein
MYESIKENRQNLKLADGTVNLKKTSTFANSPTPIEEKSSSQFKYQTHSNAFTKEPKTDSYNTGVIIKNQNNTFIGFGHPNQIEIEQRP